MQRSRQVSLGAVLALLVTPFAALATPVTLLSIDNHISFPATIIASNGTIATVATDMGTFDVVLAATECRGSGCVAHKGWANAAQLANAQFVQVAAGTQAPSASQVALPDMTAGIGQVTTTQTTLIGFDAYTVIASDDVGVPNLSARDLARIYAGDVTNWRDLGGADLPINPLRLPDGTDQALALTEVVLSPYAKTMRRDAYTVASDAEAVRFLALVPGAIAVVNTDDAPATHRLTLLNACDQPVELNAFSVNAGDYPLSRSIFANRESNADTLPVGFAGRHATGASVQISAHTYYEAPSAKAARIALLTQADIPGDMRGLAHDLMQTLAPSRRLSTTFFADHSEADLNTHVMNLLTDQIASGAMNGQEIIFAGFSNDDAAHEVSNQIAGKTMTDFQILLATQGIAADIRLKSIGFADLAFLGCDDAPHRNRIEVWVRPYQ